MYLKQLLFIILFITIRKRIKCYAKDKTKIKNIADIVADYMPTVIKESNLGFSNISNTVDNKCKIKTSSKRSGNSTNSKQHYPLTAESIAELYNFPSYDIKEISNCSYEQTINITHNASVLANGSYIYKNETIIPPQLVGVYDYEIFYNGSRRKVPRHKRACICQLKPCISVCSNDIMNNYQYAINKNLIDTLEIFLLDLTLANTTVVQTNIVEHFVPIVLREYCKSSYMLSPETRKNSNWSLFENGSLLRHSDHVLFKRTEYCFELHDAIIDNETYNVINPMICSRKKNDLTGIERINYYIHVLSVMFLLFTIITYCCLPWSVHDKCFLTYVCSLMMSFAIFSYINLSGKRFDIVTCLVLGYLNHFLQLSHYTWLGIICFDTWMTISNKRHYSYCKYAMFGYPFPFLMTLLTAAAQSIGIDETLQPGISSDRCGLNVKKLAASIYLYGPCLIILVYCLILFILTSKIITQTKKDVIKLRPTTRESGKVCFTLYFRLFLIMGLSWFFDVLSYLFNLLDLKIVSSLLDSVNALQGLYIFVNFILRGAIKQKIFGDKRRSSLRELECNSVKDVTYL